MQRLKNHIVNHTHRNLQHGHAYQRSVYIYNGLLRLQRDDRPAKFFETAYKDATDIAKVAKQWPDKFTEASDLFVGKNLHNSGHCNGKIGSDPREITAYVNNTKGTSAIAQKCEHIVDQTFVGGKRIYGPRDVVKAARIASRGGFELNVKNADTYAVFAQAVYWLDYYRDSQTSYVDIIEG
ncbi:hypothetical protein DL767_001970 [Monosporascus sp. MG133]|nr:hypothetical protein DL767_001970 [Monosporascus sp. MG133]